MISKYLRFDKSQPFISISAFLAFLGVAVGVMVLLVAMAIMNGFDKEFQRKLFTMNYPLTVTTFMPGGVTEEDVDTILSHMPHLKASPYISSQVMLRRGQKLEGAILFGVDMEKEKQINSVVAQGLGEVVLEEFGLLVGKGIQDEFLLEADARLMVLFTHVEPGGLALMPKMKRFTYQASFQSGLLAYDKAYIVHACFLFAENFGIR